jgi:AAA domain, putative AbiEii toxin, Type IV TA system/AAA ATPase domain
MFTKLSVENFKGLEHAEVPLAEAVVFIGPNNSGKTTALQALTLWDIGLHKWAEKRKDSTARERTGVTINRRDLFSIPIPSARLLWRGLHVRNIERVNGKPKTSNVKFEITVQGVSEGQEWSFGLEFDFANEESFYCRALGWPEAKDQRDQLLALALGTRVAYLPPMSGLASEEFRKEPGEISVLIGQGRTAEVLRNLCHRVHTDENPALWNEMAGYVERLFRVKLLAPVYVPERSEIRMQYEQGGLGLDLASAGRGFQQTLLLLAYLYQNPRSALLLDEPDAHLEIVRQREIYNLLTDVAKEKGSQVIAASHSEVVLNEAAERDVVVAFIGAPHRLDSRQKSQAAKALKSIRFDLYYLAETKGWMLFLEGSTDLAILRSLARKLAHPAAAVLEDPPVYYVKTNIPDHARDVFHGLREAKPDLAGLAVFDRIVPPPESSAGLQMMCWSRREIENYIVGPRVLERLARHDQPDDLFGRAEAGRRAQIMRECISELEQALRITNKPSPWSPEIKVTDDFLDPLFKNFYDKIRLRQLLFKRNYHVLADLMEPADISSEARIEIEAKLNAILTAAQAAPGCAP